MWRSPVSASSAWTRTTSAGVPNRSAIVTGGVSGAGAGAGSVAGAGSPVTASIAIAAARTCAAGIADAGETCTTSCSEPALCTECTTVGWVSSAIAQ